MEALQAWLADAGLPSTTNTSLEEDFASGYRFAQLLHTCSLQTNLHEFTTKSKPDAWVANFTRLRPTLTQLGVPLDSDTARRLIAREPGLAAKLLLAIKQRVESLSTNLTALEHTGAQQRALGVRTSATRGLLEAQAANSQHAAHDASSSRCFEDVLRKHSSSPNQLMEALHLRRFADEGARQAAAAQQGAAAAAASVADARASHRDGLRGAMAAGRAERAARLQRNSAVHAAMLRHQDDLERQELRVETALTELGRQRHKGARAAAAQDAASGIDAFEMTLRRLGPTALVGGDGSSAAAGSLRQQQQTAGPEDGSAAALGRIRGFAPTAARLADSKGEYLATIKARRHEEAAARKEREGRRRRMLVEQQAARLAAEERTEQDCLLEVLVRQSGEEQKLGARLWQLQQEKACMEADRQQREQQYAALKDKEWEACLRREGELHRVLRAEHAAATQLELTTWREQQDAAAAAGAAQRAGLARDTAWQLVQLAERVVAYRAATGGQAVPLHEWRAWLSLFLQGDPALGAPIIASGPGDQVAEPPTAARIISSAELADYLSCCGDWAAAAAAASGVQAPSGGGSATQQPEQPQQCNEPLAVVVAELGMLAQKLQRNGWQPRPAQQQQQRPEGEGGDQEVVGGDATPAWETAAQAAAGSGAAPGAEALAQMPLKLAVLGAPYAGKTSVAQHLAQSLGLKLLCPQTVVEQAIAAAQAWQQQQVETEAAAGAAATALSGEAAGGSQPGDRPPPQQLPEPPRLVALGLRAAQELAHGSAVPDALLVELLLLGMQQARDYAAPAHEPVPVDGSAAAKSGSKAAAAAKTQVSTASGDGKPEAGAVSSGAAAAAASSAAAGGLAGAAAGAQGLPLAPNLAHGVPGRGFVLDNFPATEAQAVLLEKALTGLDLAAEVALLASASLLLPPPPAAKLPQLARPLRSGLDAAVVLDCSDQAAALQRVLGRRLDPVTGRVWHLDFDPPPAKPGLTERLTPPQPQDAQLAEVITRLTAHAATSGALAAWLARFSTLQRPVDAAGPLSEVLAAAGDIAAGVLAAKSTAQAAQAAAAAACRAQEHAERAQQQAHTSRLAAEAAARDLLATKRAELQVLPLLAGGGKAPADPAAAELVKAQAAAKCAEQLRVCHDAAAEASALAQGALAAADAAAAAVLSCRKSVGDAVVSAEAQAAASKAVATAEAAAAAAAEAAAKATAAKQQADSLCQDAEKWAAAADAAGLDAAPLLAAAAPAASSAPAAAPPPPGGRASTMAGAGSAVITKAATQQAPPPQAAAVGSRPGTASSTATQPTPPPALLPLQPASGLPAPLAQLLGEEWARLEAAYVAAMGRGFADLRHMHSLAVNQVAADAAWFDALLRQPDGRQALLAEFVARFNAVEPDVRGSEDARGELLLRCEELRDALWALCDARHEAGDAARLRVVGDSAPAEHVALVGQAFGGLVQAEVDRFAAACQFLSSYCHSSHGVFLSSTAAAPPSSQAPCVLVAGSGMDAGISTSGSGGASAPARAADQASSTPGRAAAASAAASASCVSGLQQRLPQLAAALKAAGAAALAVQASTLSGVADMQQKAAAAATHATSTASAAASAAAAAVASSTQGAAAAGGHRSTSSAVGGTAASAKAAAAAAAASSKLAAASEEASAAAASAAATVRALPAASVLAAVQAELQAALAFELAQLQQRLSLLAARAALVVDEVAQLHGTAHSRMASVLRARYVAECSAVAALERVAKAAAASGQPLAHGLRLEDEALVVVEVAEPTQGELASPLPRPASPPLPPGVLSMGQLAQAAAALRAAEAGAPGWVPMQSAVDLLAGLCARGVLPPAWRSLDGPALSNALAPLDPTFSGFLDWRQLLLCLAAAALPAMHTASPAELAEQALRMEVADGDGDGCLTEAEFAGLGRWWFEPREDAEEEEAWQQPDAGQHGMRTLLWELFKQPAPTPARGEREEAAPQQVLVVPAQPLLLYLCADRDLFRGISKAVSVVARHEPAGASVDAQGLARMCYPLMGPEEAARIARAPLSQQQLAAAVAVGAAAAAAGTPVAGAVPAAGSPSQPGSRAADGRKVSAPGSTAGGEAAPPAAPTIKASQLMYGAACERVVTLLLHRHQLTDVFVAAQL